MKNIKKTLSLVIPMYNEEERINLAVRAIEAGFRSTTLKLSEVIFVNDGSTDKTLSKIHVAKRALERKGKFIVKVITYGKNKGKGYAVKRGMLAAKGDYTLLVDVDMSTPLTEMSKIDPLIKENYNVIVGTRKNGESTVVIAQPMYRQVMGHVFTKITQLVTGMKVTDFTCGFKLFSRQAREVIFGKSLIERWGYDAEILYIAELNGFTIHEKALLWYNDERTRVSALLAAWQSMGELWQIKRNAQAGLYTDINTRDNLYMRAISWVKNAYFS